MSDEKVWFISENGEIINFFENGEQANEERFYLKEENPFDKYNLYELSISELNDYPEEKEFATMLGYFDKWKDSEEQDN